MLKSSPEGDCNQHRLAPLCCLTCQTASQMADLMTIIRGSCQLIQQELSGYEWNENKVGEVVRDNIQIILNAVDKGMMNLRELHAIWILTRDLGESYCVAEMA